MANLPRIEELWEQTEGNLTQITKELVDLLHQAHTDNEPIPLHLELDVLLQANYVLGYGGSVNEISTLANVIVKLTKETSSSNPAKIHRMACTLSSAILSHLSSSQHLQENKVSDLVPWTEDDDNPSKVIHGLVNHVLILLELYPSNDWSLELITFLATLLLILGDLGSPYILSSDQVARIKSTIQDLKSNRAYETWSQSLLEKSDYYQFVTLMITQTSREEEVWLEYIQNFVE